MSSSPSGSVNPSDAVDLSTLVSLFYPGDGGELADFEPVSGEGMPDDFRRLLDHHSHMTITVEAFHESPVDVRVIQSSERDGWYCREILLVSRQGGQVVQYGIVRLRPDRFHPDVWSEIREGQVPLGQVLINHNVFRQVELVALWRAFPGPALARWLSISEADTTYGRTARIFCDGEPAIELLEIVAPV